MRECPGARGPQHVGRDTEPRLGSLHVRATYSVRANYRRSAYRVSGRGRRAVRSCVRAGLAVQPRVCLGDARPRRLPVRDRGIRAAHSVRSSWLRTVRLACAGRIHLDGARDGRHPSSVGRGRQRTSHAVRIRRRRHTLHDVCRLISEPRLGARPLRRVGKVLPVARLSLGLDGGAGQRSLATHREPLGDGGVLEAGQHAGLSSARQRSSPHASLGSVSASFGVTGRSNRV